jgi:undecaprenyl diphosphate synthase
MIPGIDPEGVPRHVAIVMDGNGRWAERQGLPRTAGHAAGEEALYRVVDAAIDLGLPWLTVYGFSTENWSRPEEEVNYLMGLPGEVVARRMAELHERNVRVKVAGRRDGRVPERVLEHIDDAVNRTAANTGLTFCIAFNYGGRAEIVDAVRAIVAKGTSPDEVDEDLLREHLLVPDMPDPDVVVRTSGERRLSNFLLWQSAYAELVFVDTLWPDFGREGLIAAIEEYQARDRRFGGL